MATTAGGAGGRSAEGIFTNRTPAPGRVFLGEDEAAGGMARRFLERYGAAPVKCRDANSGT